MLKVWVLVKVVHQDYLDKWRRNAIRNFAPDDDVVANVDLDHLRFFPGSGKVGEVRDPQLGRQGSDVPVSRSGDAAIVAGLTQVVSRVRVHPEREVTLDLSPWQFVARWDPKTKMSNFCNRTN